MEERQIQETEGDQVGWWLSAQATPYHTLLPQIVATTPVLGHHPGLRSILASLCAQPKLLEGNVATDRARDSRPHSSHLAPLISAMGRQGLSAWHLTESHSPSR